jgi:hypothetical protein
MRRFTKKRVIALAVVASLAVAGGAYAYLTATGSGSSTGNVTATAPALTISFSQPDFTVLPQQQTVNIYATNTGTSTEYFTALASFAVTSTDTTKCPAGSFVAGSTSTTAQEVPAGAKVLVGTVPVTFTDLATAAQNGCLGTGTATYTATSN